MPEKSKATPKKKKAGRPTIYDPKYCDMMREFFLQPKRKVLHITEYYQNGQLKQKKPIVLPPLYPTIERFAHSVLGVSVGTLYKWGETYPAFAKALEYARDEQKAHLMTLGLSKDFDSAFAKFLLSVRWPKDFTEKQEMTGSVGLDVKVEYGKTSGEGSKT